MKVFKFGGASVKDAQSVINVGQIVSKFGENEVLVVVSAMGKTTNLIEIIIREIYSNGTIPQKELNQLKHFHNAIAQSLHLDFDLESIYNAFITKASEVKGKPYRFIYDQIIGFGEWLSSSILFHYLNTIQSNVQFLDVRRCVVTDSNYQQAQVCWETSTELINQIDFNDKITVTQGFIGRDKHENFTSLGREGSDFTAAIFASVLNVKNVTIWKDVDGFFNADPRRFPEAKKYEQLSFREAIELAYYGASVVHPKTIQPLQRNHINLFVKSFIHPEKSGTLISSELKQIPELPSIIVKQNLFLLSVSSKDLSFIVEKELESLFGACKQFGIRVVLLQNSATSCALVLQNDSIKIPQLTEFLNSDFNLKYNSNVDLYTIRHYNETIVKEIYKKGRFILEERNNKTIQILLQSE
ncbi:MAG: aspartate kinase [Flavobacteriales bacterium]